METILKYTRAIPLALLYIYYRLIKDEFYAPILRLGMLLVILLIFLNIFIYVEHHTKKNKISSFIALIIMVLTIMTTILFSIQLFLDWN